MKLRKKVKQLEQEIRTLWIRTDSMLKWIDTIQSAISDINGSIKALDDIVTMTRGEFRDRIRGVDVHMNQLEKQYHSDQASYQNLYHKLLGVEEGLERVTSSTQESLDRMDDRLDLLSSHETSLERLWGIVCHLQEKLDKPSQIPINGNLEEEIDGEEAPSVEQLNQMMLDVYALTQSMAFRRIVEQNLTDRIEKLEAKVEELMEVNRE